MVEQRISSMSTTAEGIFSSEGPFGLQVVSVKLHLGHISRGLPLKQVLAREHAGL